MSIEKRIEKLEQRAGGKRRIICVRHVGDRKWTEAEDKEMLTQLPDRPGLYVVWWNGEKFTKLRYTRSITFDDCLKHYKGIELNE